MSRPAWARRCGERLVGGSKVDLPLGWLQLSSCQACECIRYFSFREASYATMLASPGRRLRAVRCAEFWQFSSPPPAGRRARGNRDTTAAETRPLPAGAEQRVDLDEPGRGERRCDRPDPVGRKTDGTPHTVGARTGPSDGRGAIDSPEDTDDTRAPRTVAVRRPHGRRPAMADTGGVW